MQGKDESGWTKCEDWPREWKRGKVSEMRQWMSEERRKKERTIKAMKNPLFYPRDNQKYHRVLSLLSYNYSLSFPLIFTKVVSSLTASAYVFNAFFLPPSIHSLFFLLLIYPITWYNTWCGNKDSFCSLSRFFRQLVTIISSFWFFFSFPNNNEQLLLSLSLSPLHVSF